MEWEVWDFSSDPNLLGNDDKCGFTQLLDLTGDGVPDLATADLDTIRRARIKLGISTHSDQELKIALAADPDYVALGPIYPTLLKKMPWAPAWGSS